MRIYLYKPYNLIVCFILFFSTNVYGDELFLPDIPLFTESKPAPNLFLTLDNSTSMFNAHIFDSGLGCYEDAKSPCYASSEFNKIYYNPDISYLLPYKADGTQLPLPDFEAAWINGFDDYAVGGSTEVINLAEDYEITKNLRSRDVNRADKHSSKEVDRNTFEDGGTTHHRAHYMRFEPVITACDTSDNGGINRSDCYVVVNIDAADEENFAIWYSYYRTRMLATLSAVSLAFSRAPHSLRVGWRDLNVMPGHPYPNSREGSIHFDNKNYVAQFTGAHREEFFSWLLSMENASGTPLVGAMQIVGEYMRSTDFINPYKTEPGVNDYDPITPGYTPADDLSCRSSYHIMFTDGNWGDGGKKSVKEFDDINWTLPDDKAYTPRPPYRGNAYDFVADHAFYYWATDLRDLDDNVEPYFADTSGTDDENYWNPMNDPATWQHLVNFNVTLGVSGNLVFPDDYAGLFLSSNPLEWGDSKNDDGDAIDDMWHAALNSRGDYFSANSTGELIDAFNDIIARVSSRTATAAAVTTDSTEAASTEYIYKNSFSNKDWSGSLKAYAFSDLVAGANEVFDAGAILDAQEPLDTTAGARRLFSINSALTSASKGVPFRRGTGSSTPTNGLSASQMSNLDTIPATADQILDYIRGDRTNEASNTGGVFRSRSTLLGDIIHSEPELVLFPQRMYPNPGDWSDKLYPSTAALLPENQTGVSSFTDFVGTVSSARSGMLYVGANDGVLHAFHAETGEEVFGYVPGVLLPKLPEFTEPAYQHKYFVDGSPVEYDAFFNSDGLWHTVLVGHLRTGGQAVYALDVTEEPEDTDSEQDVAGKILWEFTHNDLGYSYGDPQVVRLHNNRWAVVFGNGYNNTELDGSASADGNASIFIVDLQTGTPIRQIKTGAGSAITPNGIGSILPLDIDGDHITDYVYGGDLQGNLWKFDLTSQDSGIWGIKDRGIDNLPIPIFKATNNDGEFQPVTAAPVSVINPIEGVMILFGTGKYLESEDNNPVNASNSYYGIWDRNIAPLTTSISRDVLNPRTIGATGQNGLRSVREITGDPMDYSDTSILGWYFDFDAGEIQFTKSLELDSELTIFTTYTGSTNECDKQGSSWLYAINPFSGTDPGYTSLDINGDGVFNDSDRATGSTGYVSALEVPATVANLVVLELGSAADLNGQMFSSYEMYITGVSENLNITSQTRDDIEGDPYMRRIKWRQIK